MWNGWSMERMLFLFLGVTFLAIFVQVTLFHSRQNFRHPAMWFPVIGTPLLGVLSLWITSTPSAALITLFGVLAALGAVTGVVGTYFHLVGVGERVGGYTVNNFMTGPPPVLPLMVTVVSVLGLVVVLFHR